jgi:peptidoglycan/xylan/chitin deacetylase (PgdA/CDA1 family)
MKETINRRSLMKIVSGSLAAVSFGLAIDPTIALYPSSGSVQVLSRAFSSATPVPLRMLPNMIDKKIRFLASHELVTGDTNREVVMMTYDDVLDNERLSHLLDVYQKYGVKCSFFIIGIDQENCREILARLINERHDLSCHGWAHDCVFTSPSDKSIHEFQKVVGFVADIRPGNWVKYSKSTYCNRDQRVPDTGAAKDMQHTMWTLESGSG